MAPKMRVDHPEVQSRSSSFHWLRGDPDLWKLLALSQDRSLWRLEYCFLVALLSVELMGQAGHAALDTGRRQCPHDGSPQPCQLPQGGGLSLPM